VPVRGNTSSIAVPMSGFDGLRSPIDSRIILPEDPSAKEDGRSYMSDVRCTGRRALSGGTNR
jgi:hypothetical protein